MAFIEDRRNGIGYSVSIQLAYEAEKKVGTNSDGIDRFISFAKVPYYIKRTTRNVIGTKSDWDGKTSDMISSTLAFAERQTGTFIESVSPGSRLIINGTEYFDGSYVETYYSAVVAGAVGNKRFESRSGSVSVGGHWQGDGLLGKIFFTTSAYGEQATQTFTASDSGFTIGGAGSFAGVDGIVSSISQQNPRVLNGQLVYDFSVTVTETTGKNIPVL